MTFLGRRKYFASFTCVYFKEIAHFRLYEYLKCHRWVTQMIKAFKVKSVIVLYFNNALQ